MSDRTRRSEPFARAAGAWLNSNPAAAKELVNAIVSGYRLGRGKSTDPADWRTFPQPEPPDPDTDQEKTADGKEADAAREDGQSQTG